MKKERRIVNETVKGRKSVHILCSLQNACNKKKNIIPSEQMKTTHTWHLRELYAKVNINEVIVSLA